MILERLKEYIDFKNISVSAFERSIGMSNASFGKSLKNGGAIGSDKLENILSIYPEINPVWLLTGNGNMICDSLPYQSSSNRTDSSQNEVLITFLKEQAKEKDSKIEAQAQEIGALKAELSNTKKEVDIPLFQIKNIEQSSLFKSPDVTSAHVPSKKTSKANKKQQSDTNT